MDSFWSGSPDLQWRGKYPLSWCEQCSVAIIGCPSCKNTSCNGSGCDQCNDVFEEFMRADVSVETYLSHEETKTYHKAQRIKHFIIQSLEKGDTKINWKKLRDEGQMSRNDEETFARELA